MKHHLKLLLFTILFAFCLPAVGRTADTPGEPSGLRLIIEGKGFLLTWNASPDDPGMVTGYEIDRAEVASGPFETVGKVEAGVLKYKDGKAKQENIYYYKVRAVSHKAAKAYSPYSNTVTGELAGN